MADRFAILSKTHHALVDGVSGLDILSVLFAPGRGRGRPGRGAPRPAPSARRLLTEALVERATNAGELVARSRALARARARRVEPRRARPRVGAGALAWRAAPGAATPYNAGRSGPDRRFTWARGSLDDVKAIKNTLGGTVNDVVLTVVTRALRAPPAAAGEDVDGLELKAFVPVSVRADDRARRRSATRSPAMLAALPVGCADPVELPGADLRQMRVAQGVRPGRRRARR